MAAEITRFTQRSIERRNAVTTHRLAKTQVRGTKELDQCPSREITGDACDDRVERRGERFGGKRECVEHLRWNAARSENLPREIDVRQRSSDNQRRAVQRAGRSATR